MIIIIAEKRNYYISNKFEFKRKQQQNFSLDIILIMYFTIRWTRKKRKIQHNWMHLLK